MDKQKKMCAALDPIVISSDEDDDFVSRKEKPRTENVIVIDSSPSPTQSKVKSKYVLSKEKLKTLKSRKQWNRLRTKTRPQNSGIESNYNGIEVKDESPAKLSSSLLQIDQMGHLKAVSKGNWERSPIKYVKNETMENETKNPPCMVLSSAIAKVSSSKMENSKVRCKLKLSSPVKPLKTQEKKQSDLKDWVTLPRKRHCTQPLVPKPTFNEQRNELLWPPNYVTLNENEFIDKLYGKAKAFPQMLDYLVESLIDVDLLESVIITVHSLLEMNVPPSVKVIWYLVNNVLIEEPKLVYLTYSLLVDIIERFPKKCIEMNVTLPKIMKYFSQLGKKDKTKINYSNLKTSFLLFVLCTEMKATALKSKFTRLTKNFGVDFDLQPVKDIIPSLKESIQNHMYSPGCHEVENVAICNLDLLGSMLKLFMISSKNKADAAIRIADELMNVYISLPGLEERVLLLQSITSHHVRQQLIKVLLMNYCSLLPEALTGRDLPLSMKKIIFQDFLRKPPKRGSGIHSSAEEVEEYLTLLTYIIQSYVFTHSSALLTYHNDYPLCNTNDGQLFSQEDLVLLEDLRYHVSELQSRCERFLQQGDYLSQRTIVLIEIMEFMV